MKKICLFLLLVCMVLTTADIAAKTTKKSSSKKSTTYFQKPNDVKVDKNFEGYPDPTGHVYKFSAKGVSITIDFETRYNVGVVTVERGVKTVESLGWSQDRATIYMPEVMFEISPDGKILTELEYGTELYIYK